MSNPTCEFDYGVELCGQPAVICVYNEHRCAAHADSNVLALLDAAQKAAENERTRIRIARELVSAIAAMEPKP